MTFTEVFGGTTIYPSGVSYRAVALSANQTLSWPVETATNANIVAQIMDVTPSIAALSILMPPANEASVGETTLFFNAGSFAFTVKDNGGNTIVSIAPGLSYQVYLIGNNTVNGSWRSTQYAAGTSSATAGSLVGAGIKAINTTLNQSMAVTSLNTNYTIGDADRSEAFLWSGGAGTLTLPSAVAVGNDWFCHVRNNGTGAISLATTGGQLINGASSLAFNPGDSAIIICDGSGFFTIGFGQSASFAFDYVSIDLTSQTSPYTLAGANLNRIAYSFGGTLTANMTIHIPATFQQYWLANETLGGFAITVKVAGQTGVIIGNGVRAICYCNGTDLVDADTSSFSFPVSIAQGGTGAVNESGARINLGGTSTGIAVFTAPSAASARSTLSAAVSGANNDITSLTGLTTPLSVGQGGTGTATAFTSGSVVFSGASGVYSQDNANLFWDNATDRLGVGTNTPSHALDVFNAANGVIRVGGGNSTNQGAAYYVKNASNSNTLAAFGDRARIFGGTPDQLVSIFTGAAPLTFDVNGTERMRITSGGVVGIGTDSPSYKLEVRTDAASGFNWVASNNNTATGSFGAGFLAATGLGASYFYMRGDGITYLENASNNPLGFATNAQERMRITAAGDVGIGATLPTERFQVNINTGINGFEKGISLTNTVDANLFNYVTGTATTDKRAFITAGAANQSLTFGTLYTERMRITSAGNVGIGTIAPNAKLEAVGGSTQNKIRVSGSTFTDTVADVVIGRSGTNDTGLARAPAIEFSNTTDASGVILQGSNQFQIFTNNAGAGWFERMRITDAGDVGIGTSSPTSKLHVDGTVQARVGATGVQIYGDGGSGYVNSVGANPLILQVNSSERMRVTSAGNVGIGTQNPAARLQVVNSSLASQLRLQDTEVDATRKYGVVGSGHYTNSEEPVLLVMGDSNSAANEMYIGGGVSTMNAVSNIRFLTAATNTTLTGTERMRITDAGDVGIGIMSPGSPLDVLTNSSALGVSIRGRASDNVGSLALRSNDGATIYGQVQGRSTDFRIDVGSSNIFTVYTSSSERFRITSTGGITSSDLADAVGYKGIPQNSQTSSYTLALSDMGKHISITTGGVVIPANGAVAFPIGSAVTIFNNSSSNQTISITTDTLRQAGTANTGSRTLAQYGVATVLKVTSTVWVISGAGIT